MDWGKKISIIEDVTGKSIAKEIDESSAFISALRVGKSKNPKSEFIAKLIKAFNLNPLWLFNDEGEMFLSEDKNIQIQHITIGQKLTEENSILFLWTSALKEEKLLQILQTFTEKNGNIKTLFMPYFTKDEKFTNLEYVNKLTETCKSRNIDLQLFPVSDIILKNTDSISSIKYCMIESIFPQIQSFKPSHLWLALPKTDNDVIINISHALLGLFVIDEYFTKTFPQDSVTLCQIEEENHAW